MLSFPRKTLLLFLLFPSLSLFSQQKDSPKSYIRKSTVIYFNQNQFEYSDSVSFIENSLYNFPKYLNKNNLGNNGLAFNDLSYSPSISNYIGFNYSKNNYINYFFTPTNFKFYNTRSPYTDLFYIIGSKKEQLFKMVFSYNVKKNWNITADFSRIRSEGFYLRQNTNHNFIAFSSNYKSLNNRYYLLASIIYNNAKNSENGGIINEDSVRFNSELTNKKLIGVNLSNAKRVTINRSIYFKQYLNLGNKSQDIATLRAILPESRITLATLYEDNILKYEDEMPWSGYYPAIYYDSTRTFDSTYQRKFENELAWKRVNNKKHRGFKDILGIEMNIKHQLIKVNQRELFKVSDISVPHGLINTKQEQIDTALSNIIAGGGFFNTYSKNKLWWNLCAKYALRGYNKGDYYIGAILKKALKDSLNFLFFKVEEKLQTADYIYSHYVSNHFKWNNNFGKMKERHASVHFEIKKYNLALSATYRDYTNVFYFNDSAIAKQDTGSIPVLSFFLKKDFVYHNWHLNNKITYQNVPKSSVIRVPKLISEHSLYYENDVFKRAMRLQAGVSVFYPSAYYANAYMPATGQFYLQAKKMYGSYPFIDFFIAARIKTVRIFLKIDHLNSGLMESEKYKLVQNNYILTPNYPINDRAFKFGVSWIFYD